MFSALQTLVQNPLVAIGTFIGGMALLLVGGHWLVLGSVTIARRLGVSTLVIGLTLVAGGTSSPELFFNVIAAAGGHSELSFGNIIGSNIANIGLILGITALITPLAVHGAVVKKELPWLIVVTVAVLLLAVAPPAIEASRGGFGRIDGVLMLLVFTVFMVSWYRMGRRDAADRLVKEVGEEAEADTQSSVALASLLFVAGLVFLLAGAKVTETASVSIARWLGMSDALIGLTIVAIATSLPELTTAVVACRKGHHDLAVGTIVGSNLFNLLLVLGVTSTVAPVLRPEFGLHDLIAMTVITLLLLPMAITHRKRISRTEGGLLLVLYLGYMTHSVLREL